VDYTITFYTQSIHLWKKSLYPEHVPMKEQKG